MDEQIYNADETGIYYKMLPDKTLAVKSDEHKKEGFKSIKDRLTLLFTVNKTGNHKLKPLCIGKSRAPRCFHHVNMKALPFIHANSKNAWMTSDIFEDQLVSQQLCSGGEKTPPLTQATGKGCSAAGQLSSSSPSRNAQNS